jgi:hypothetical protein
MGIRRGRCGRVRATPVPEGVMSVFCDLSIIQEQTPWLASVEGWRRTVHRGFVIISSRSWIVMTWGGWDLGAVGDGGARRQSGIVLRVQSRTGRVI